METVKPTTAARISRSTVESYALIAGPGKYIVTASGQNNAYINPKIAEVSDNYEKSFLVNLRAIEIRKVGAIAKIFGTAEEVEVTELRNMLMVASINLNVGQATPALPIRGEKIEILCEWAVDKDGNFVLDKVSEQKILNVVSLKVLPAVQPAKFSFNEAIKSITPAPESVQVVMNLENNEPNPLDKAPKEKVNA